MLILMRDLEHRNRIRQLMLTAAALLGLAILAATMVSAGAHAAENPTSGTKSQNNLSAADRADLLRIDTYLSSLTNLQGHFLQVGPDGSLAQGTFYLRRPGRMRFEYEPPEKLLVVADGTWVAVKDGFSATQRYPIGATPLGILLDQHVDLAKEVKVLAVEHQPGALRVTLADKSGNAPGNIILVFDEPALQLRQWIVTDAQGLQTTVALRDMQSGVQADNALFVLKTEQRPSFGAH